MIDDHDPNAIENNPLLCRAIERNIRTLIGLRRRTASRRTFQEKAADRITDVSGRMLFVYLHAGWFGVWILLNTGRFGIRAFDPFPYGLLTMIVSLEAIFLSTFVLISQNRISAEADRRADLDLQIGLLTEHEITRVLQMLDAIQDRLGIENSGDDELAELEHEVRPEDVLSEIERIEHRFTRRHRPGGRERRGVVE